MRASLFVVLLLAGAALRAAETFAGIPFAPKPVDARVPAYAVRSDLGNVSNRNILPKLTTAQRMALASNAFVARPTAEEQLFYLYENNTYKKIPSFVTTDSVLHTYHVFYDFTLRYLEKEQLLPAAKELSRHMLDANLAALNTNAAGNLHTALVRNAAFFAVPLILLGEKPALPAEVKTPVDLELARIERHTDWTPGLTGAHVDYTQFVPRGHYTRSEAFKRYFKAMMWYGLVPMNLIKENTRDEVDTPAVLQALIVTDQLTADAQARALWRRLYDPTVFYVGKADDLSYSDYAACSAQVFGPGGSDRFDNAEKLAQFAALVQTRLPGPGIRTYNLFAGGLQGKQFRFMGQRFIPDSRILQELTYPRVGNEGAKRYFPLGLDVFAVLGDPRAAQLIDTVYRETRFDQYLAQRNKLQQEIRAMTPADWGQNLYYGWMYCLLPLTQPRPQGYPSFMRGLAWRDKSLVTMLGSWTELRHDTILYAKQSAVAECGDSGEEPPPPTPGYVEPEVGLYERLAWLLRLNRAGLAQRSLLKDGDELAQGFDDFIDLVTFLAAASRKELRNAPLSREELRTLERYGGQLEWLMLSVSSLGSEGQPSGWWEIASKTDRNMALVADVHTANTDVLEEAVGHAAEIWVIVPFNGKLILTRGATFTYYEFQHPSRDRLTDEAWQSRLQAGKAPPMPAWTGSYLRGPGPTKPAPENQRSNGETGGGC